MHLSTAKISNQYERFTAHCGSFCTHNVLQYSNHQQFMTDVQIQGTLSFIIHLLATCNYSTLQDKRIIKTTEVNTSIKQLTFTVFNAADPS